MAITFHNQRVLGRARTDHADYLREKDGLSQRMVECLKMDPSTMAQQLEEQRRSLLGRCQKEMKEAEPEKKTLLMELEEDLTQEAKTFLETYEGRYQCHANNQSVMDRALQDYAAFLREKDDLSQSIACLTVTPSTMEEQFMKKRSSLLGQCREEMKEPEEILLMALEVELTRRAENFLKTYRESFWQYIKMGVSVVAAVGAGARAVIRL